MTDYKTLFILKMEIMVYVYNTKFKHFDIDRIIS